MHRLFAIITVTVGLSGCGATGQFFPDFQSSGTTPGGSTMTSGRSTSGGGAAGPIRPETLVACRGHVLVPAMGMTFVPFGGQPPAMGQFLREESLTPPYRVLPPGAAATMDNVPSRLNVDLDRNNRIVNLRCG